MKIKNIVYVLFACLFLQVSIFSQQSMTAKVVGVVDGDTITVITNDNKQLTIRFAEIDAPELDQEFGAIVKQQLAEAIGNQTVSISDLKKDCRDRLTASVSFNNKNLNLQLVEVGYAWTDKTCQPNEIFSKAESAAREKKIGLWQYPNPVRPTEFLTAKQAQTKDRKIFSGLAPNMPGGSKKLAIGMTLESFISICGKEGDLSTMTTTEYGQGFYIEFPSTEENVKKNCDGRFRFYKSIKDRDFKLDAASQEIQ